MTKILSLALAAGLIVFTPLLALPVLLTAGLTLACTTTVAPSPTMTGPATAGTAGPDVAGADPGPSTTATPRVSGSTGRATAPPASTTTGAVAPATPAAAGTATNATVAATVQARPAVTDCLTGAAMSNVRARLLVPAGTAGDVAAAVARALSYVGLSTGYAHHCDRLACRAYNYANSGYETATAHWNAMTATGHAHPGDRCPPLGALLFWDTRDPAGHVAFVAASDPGCAPTRIQVVTNDYGDAATGNHGGVYLVSLAAIEAGFVTRAGYRGWSDPICAGTQLPAGTRHPLPS